MTNSARLRDRPNRPRPGPPRQHHPLCRTASGVHSTTSSSSSSSSSSSTTTTTAGFVSPGLSAIGPVGENESMCGLRWPRWCHPVGQECAESSSACCQARGDFCVPTFGLPPPYPSAVGFGHPSNASGRWCSLCCKCSSFFHFPRLTKLRRQWAPPGVGSMGTSRGKVFIC